MSVTYDPLIRMSGVSRIFHTADVETHALSGIDLEIRAGDYLAVGGPSGCGKTTLLSILGLLDSPSEGSYVLAGEPVMSLNQAQRARVRSRAIGFIFQAFNLIGDLTVYKNVELPLIYRGVAVARAVAGRPLVLLADEPTGNLDSRNGAEVMALLGELNREGATICIVTHDERYAGEARRNVRLFDGRLVESDPLHREVA
ncbi:MAG: ABC transporter ATP-binding protein [Gemmatimonadales bacterium]